MSDIDCYICKSETALGDSFKCEGSCARRMHARCVGMNKTAYKAYIDLDNLFYMCESCGSIKAINAKLDKIMNLIAIYDERVSRYEMNMIELKESLRDLKLCVNNKNESVTDALNVMNKQCAPTKKSSYADKVRCNEPVILVVPKQTQSTEATQKAVKELMDPSEFPVDNMRNAGKGTVVLEGRSKTDLDIIQKYAAEKLGETYEVKLSELKKPKILISGMTEKLSNEEITSKLKAQNTILQDASFRVVSTFGKNTFSAVIEIDTKEFNEIMSSDRKKLNIGWSCCSVKEYVDLMICYKCQGFHHKAKECTRKVACKKCSGEHNLSECKSKVIKCTNCFNANEKLNLKLNVNHMAGAETCKVTQRHMNIRRKRVQYNVPE